MFLKANFARVSFVAAVLAPGALAQVNQQWASFTQTTTRIKDSNGNNAAYITGDPDEKDFAMGDVNNDGWTDLVIVRKQPAATTGKRVNYLLMNENGNLVDRSAQFASDSTVAGDSGFMTPTNDRDVQLVDVNLDGWLDIVTATTLSDGSPKYISHPRVYMNKGAIAGVWQGFKYEEPRIPQLISLQGVQVAPRFCAVAAGDVTGDGYPDLYFSDYDSTETNITEPSNWDLDDRLLINDGTGTFTDSNQTRMNSSMLVSAFGMAANIIDMNGDGVNDVVKATALGTPQAVNVCYNNPASVGFFNLLQSNVGTTQPYHVDAADINKDGRPDIIMSDDGTDQYRINTGNDGLGRVVWGGLLTLTHQDGTGDDGFAGTNHFADLDLDGFPEGLVTDVDVDLPGCSRRSKIYHNRGGAVGSNVVLTEEAQQSGSGGWKGVVGMVASDFTGGFDVATLDIDHDGDIDMVWGRCNGTFVWLNNISSCPITSFGTAVPSSIGKPGVIGFQKTSSLSHNHLILTAHDLPPNKTALFLYGTTQLGSPVAFGNGNRWVGGPIQRFPATTSDATGKVSYPVDFTTYPLNTLVVGDTRYFQCWFRDPAAGGANSNVTDAEAITVCQ